jgi:hypothetical protein
MISRIPHNCCYPGSSRTVLELRHSKHDVPIMRLTMIDECDEIYSPCDSSDVIEPVYPSHLEWKLWSETVLKLSAFELLVSF